MNYLHIDKCSISNGQGIRVVLWTAGCTMNCKGCHNPQAQDFNAGVPLTEETVQYLFSLLDEDYTWGLTLSGGHPLDPLNVPDVYDLVKRIKEKFPNKTIWIYTGYTWEELLEPDKQQAFEIVKMCDVLVDGRFILDQRDITLAFRGSFNQRIINIPHSIAENKVVLWESK